MPHPVQVGAGPAPGAHPVAVGANPVLRAARLRQVDGAQPAREGEGRLVGGGCGLVELVTERSRNVRWSCEIREPAAALGGGRPLFELLGAGPDHARSREHAAPGALGQAGLVLT